MKAHDISRHRYFFGPQPLHFVLHDQTIPLPKMLDDRLERHLLLVVYDERTALEPLELRTRETLICRYNHIYPCHLLELAYLPLKVVRGPEAHDLKVDLRAILLEAKVRYEDVR